MLWVPTFVGERSVDAIIEAVNAAHRAFYPDGRNTQPYFPVLEDSASAYRG